MLIKLVLFLSVLTKSAFGLSGQCPTVCACKWKGGKQTVECIDRALITIPENVDPETQVLDMSGNNLQILPKETFRRAGLQNLQRVYLKSCRVGQIDDQAFKGLTNLIELDLSYNLLTFIPSGTFQDVPFLRDLILSNNPIQKIDSHAFQYIPGLVRLDLSHCELQMIAPKAFEGVESMESLKLNGNRLTELRPRTVETLRRLHGVELHDNPWLCDCRLRAAKEWLTENNIPYPISPVCSGGPERVIDKTFAELHIDEFACKPEMLPVSRYIEATSGENATITCRAGAVPSAEIKWYWNGRLLVNNSAFSSYQKIYIFEEGHFEKRSNLVLTNTQDNPDSSEFYCVAENRAGNAEANFTVHVSLRTAGIATLGSGQIVGLSAALVILILFILLIILVLLVRLRRMPFSESKTPGQLEVVTVVNGSAISANGKGTLQTPSPNVETSSFTERKPPSELSFATTNPVQKPPRLTDSYTTSHYGGAGSVVSPGNHFVSPSSGSGNNPDLINDTRRLGSGEIPTDELSAMENDRPGSGEYSRNVSDSLYPSGLWEQSSEAYLPRSGSENLPVYSYNDKTPIIDSTSTGDETDFSQVLPRPQPNGYPPDYGLPIVEHKDPLGAPQSAKTLRVWQRQGVPVLPPVTALKRALTSNRNSPDEGYQEGCGTDV